MRYVKVGIPVRRTGVTAAFKKALVEISEKRAIGIVLASYSDDTAGSDIMGAPFGHTLLFGAKIPFRKGIKAVELGYINEMDHLWKGRSAQTIVDGISEAVAAASVKTTYIFGPGSPYYFDMVTDALHNKFKEDFEVIDCDSVFEIAANIMCPGPWRIVDFMKEGVPEFKPDQAIVSGCFSSMYGKTKLKEALDKFERGLITACFINGEAHQVRQFSKRYVIDHLDVFESAPVPLTLAFMAR